MTNAPEHEPPRRLNTSALRTLQSLERTLKRHLDELMQVDCEDAEAAEAVVFAIKATEISLKNVEETRGRFHRG